MNDVAPRDDTGDPEAIERELASELRMRLAQTVDELLADARRCLAELSGRSLDEVEAIGVAAALEAAVVSPALLAGRVRDSLERATLSTLDLVEQLSETAALLARMAPVPPTGEVVDVTGLGAHREEIRREAPPMS